jgi:hypothetical protein
MVVTILRAIPVMAAIVNRPEVISIFALVESINPPYGGDRIRYRKLLGIYQALV